MKIALFYELPFGGARRVANEHAKRLKKQHHIDLYLSGSRATRSEKPCYTNTFEYTFKETNYSGNNWFNKLKRDWYDLRKLKQLHKKIAEDINKLKYDFIIIHPSMYTQAPYLLRFVHTKKIYYCHEVLRLVYDPVLAIDKNLPWFKQIYEQINRFNRRLIDIRNVKFAEHIFANSNYTKRMIQSTYNREAEICYPGVDTKLFRPKSFRKKYDVLFIGRKEYLEGYDLLDEAKEYLREKAYINYVVRGKSGKGISDIELIEEINRSELVVTLSRNEPFGLTALESMACGVPVIAVSEGGFKETILDGKTGLLIKRDAHMLANAIDTLLDEDVLRIRLGTRARKMIEDKWTWDHSYASLTANIRKWIRK